MQKKQKSHEIELSQEELEETIEKIEEFDDYSFTALAGTDKYEIIPTMLEDGTIVGRKEMNVLKREIERLGYSILYRVDNPNGETLLINPKSNRVMVLKEGLQ